MSGAINIDACHRPRHVPGPGKPGATLHQLCLCPSMHVWCWQHRREPSFTTCPVSPDLANPARRLINTVFFLAHHYLLVIVSMTNSAPLCARSSTTTRSTPATPTRHRPRLPRARLYQPTLSATSTTTQRAINSLGQLVGFLYSPRVCDPSPPTMLPLRLRGDVSPLAAILSSLTVRDAPVVRNATATTAVGC